MTANTITCFIVFLPYDKAGEASPALYILSLRVCLLLLDFTSPQASHRALDGIVISRDVGINSKAEHQHCDHYDYLFHPILRMEP